MARPKSVKANPTKAFFVRMITRDISLEDCILDLIDNCIDGASRLLGGRRVTLSDSVSLSAYRIKIDISSTGFSILDNCGGITLDNAAEYAFTFGRKEDAGLDKYSIGVYGIGMKRAVFKMGSRIRITSTYESKGGRRESYAVPIDVSAWLNERDDSGPRNWDFDIESATPLPDCGVHIDITELNEDAAASFSSETFIQNLGRMIARDYAIHLHRGLVIELNKKPIRGWQIELRQSAEFAPMRTEYQEKLDRATVRVEIIAGMAVPPPETLEPELGIKEDDRFGWYVACNGRIVLAADKSAISGWGSDDWPRWHYQYNGFIGLIIFTSEDAGLLPLTTTKRSVDTSSVVYRRAMPKMREVSRQWIAYTNAKKGALSAARKFESATKPVPIYSIRKREAVALPSFGESKEEKVANINYVMPLVDVRRLGKALGSINMSFREVGIHSFEYAFKNLVGED